MSLQLRRRTARILRREQHPSFNDRLFARLDEQDAAIARLRLALDEVALALDRRMLDHYALTELARAEFKLRTAAIEKALSSPEGAVAELLAAEAALVDSYLIHHVGTLAEQIAAQQMVGSAAAPDPDLLLQVGAYGIVVPGGDLGLVSLLLRGRSSDPQPGVTAVLEREVVPDGLTVEAAVNGGFHALTIAQCLGEGGSVICLEPVPRLAECLRRTLVLNGLATRAEVRVVALDSPKERRDADGVFVGTLDSQIPAGRRVDLVKLSARGCDPVVWRGTERIRSDNPAVVFVLEWTAAHLRRAGLKPGAIMAQFRESGFAAFLIATDDPRGEVAPLKGDPAEFVDATILLRRV